MKLVDKFKRAKKIADDLRRLSANGTMFLDMGMYDDNAFRISFFPPKEYAEAVVRYAMKTVGRLTKGDDGSMQGTKDGATIVLFHVLSCSIVDWEEVREPVMAPTGEYTIKQRPVYECRSPLAVDQEVAQEETN